MFYGSPCTATYEEHQDDHEDEAGHGDAHHPEHDGVLGVRALPRLPVQGVPVVDIHVELGGHQHDRLLDLWSHGLLGAHRPISDFLRDRIFSWKYRVTSSLIISNLDFISTDTYLYSCTCT